MDKNIFNKLKRMKRQSVIFVVVVLVCTGGVIAFLSTYFEAYKNPYMAKQLIDLSTGWQYQIDNNPLKDIDNLKSGPKIQSGETLILYRTLDVSIPEAAVLIRTNHQKVNLYLEDVQLLASDEQLQCKNPGMALHFILLPPDYLNQTLKLEITSPYSRYAGHTNPILLGTIPSLEAFALSHSMRSVVLMAMCLLLGLCIIALTVIQAVNGSVNPGNLAIGVFAVIWALYYVCTEYIVFQFFTPVQTSILSLGFYFSFQVPLTLFFYFSFKHYKKWMLPAVILHGSFVLISFILQLLDVAQLPQLLDINNILLAGLVYTLILAVLEAMKKNHLMMLTAPFLTIAYISMLYNFKVFYSRSGVVGYSYKDTYFLLILIILVYNIQQFFKRYYHALREKEMLTLQNQSALQSYEQIKTQLEQMGGLKHEMQSHLAAIHTYLQDDRYEETQNYVAKYIEQVSAIAKALYHENILVNAVVGNLVRQAEQSNIELELNLKPCRIGAAEPDLYSVLNNILNNALEACAAQPEGQERFIRLYIARREPYLHITCVNSKTDETIVTDGKIQTTKSDSESHGYGLWIIRRIVKDYNGIFDIEYDENTFTITTALKD